MGPKGSRGEKVQIYFCYRFAVTEMKIFCVQGQKGSTGPRGVEGSDGEPVRYNTIVSWHCVWMSINLLRIDCIYVIYDVWAKRCNENYYTCVIKLSLLWWKDPVLIYCITELLLWITEQLTVYSTFWCFYMYRVLLATQVQLDLEVPRERKYVVLKY